MKKIRRVIVPIYAFVSIDVPSSSDEEAKEKAYQDCLNIRADLGEMELDHDENVELLPYHSLSQGNFSSIPHSQISVTMIEDEDEDEDKHENESEVPEHLKCTCCRSDLRNDESVTRTYFNKDDLDEDGVSLQGCYREEKNGKDYHFESNETLNSSRYDVNDDSDSCTNCGQTL